MVTRTVHLRRPDDRPLCAVGGILHHYVVGPRWSDVNCVRCTTIVRDSNPDNHIDAAARRRRNPKG